MSGRHRRQGDDLPEVEPEQTVVPVPPVDRPVVQGRVVDASPPQQVARGHRHARPGPPDVPLPAEAGGAARATVPRSRQITQPPATGGQTIVVRRDRTELRRARAEAERRRRMRWLLYAAPVVAALLIVALVLFLTLRGSGGTTTTTDTAAPKQQTLLVQVVGPDGVATGSALIGISKNQASGVLIPSRLVVDAVGSGTMPFGETVTLPSADAASNALTDLLGVSVQHHLVLDQTALARLVDSVGGVRVNVDVDITRSDKKGNTTVVIPAGNQELHGAGAAMFATYGKSQEPELARIARFNDVLDAVFAKLPSDAGRLGKVLGSLGDHAKSDLQPTALAALLAPVVGRSLAADVLPVKELDTGGAVESYSIDSAQAPALLRSTFPGALLHDASGSVVRVLVENGVGTPDLVEKARTRLVKSGFQFVNGGNASSFGVKSSVVLIKNGTDTSQRQGDEVATSLGLPANSVEISTRGQTVADVIVILGRDFPG
jgi:hypothetical protein